MLDYPLTAMVALSMAIFVKSKGLRSPLYIAVPVVSALAFLTKEYGVLYLLPFYAYYSALYQRPSVKRVCISVIVFLTIILIWIFPSRDTLFTGYKEAFLWGKTENDPQHLYPSLAHSFRSILDNTGIPLVIMVSLGMVRLFQEKKHRNFIYVAVLTGITVIVYFSAMPNKDPRYMVGLSILLAMLAGGGISLLSHVGLRYASVASLCIIAVLYVCSVEFGINTPLFRPDSELVFDHTDWPIHAVLIDLEKQTIKPASVLIMADLPYINGITFDYYAHLYEIPIHFYGRPAIAPQLDDYIRQLKHSEYLLKVDDVSNITGGDAVSEYIRQTYAYFETIRETFMFHTAYPLPNGTSLMLYQKRT